MFCCTLLYAHSSIAIILMGKRELVALLYLSSLCLVMVEWLFLTVPWGCLPFVIVVFPDHTHLLFMLLLSSLVHVDSYCLLGISASSLGSACSLPFSFRGAIPLVSFRIDLMNDHAFASVLCCLVVTCWGRADLLALVCNV